MEKIPFTYSCKYHYFLTINFVGFNVTRIISEFLILIDLLIPFVIEGFLCFLNCILKFALMECAY